MHYTPLMQSFKPRAYTRSYPFCLFLREQSSVLRRFLESDSLDVLTQAQAEITCQLYVVNCHQVIVPDIRQRLHDVICIGRCDTQYHQRPVCFAFD